RPSLHRCAKAALATEVGATARFTLLPIPPQLALARQAEPHQLFLGTPGPASDARSDRPAAQGAFASSAGTGAAVPRAARSASSPVRSFASSNRYLSAALFSWRAFLIPTPGTSPSLAMSFSATSSSTVR